MAVDNKVVVVKNDSIVIFPREYEVILLVAEGLKASAIGDRLNISKRTAQKHICDLFEKLDVHSRAEMLAKLFKMGTITVEDLKNN
jgi:DNA-binding NarL/FixJ family response regulator